MTLKTPEDVLQFAKDNGAKMVDLKFTDLPGSWQHFSVPARELKEEIVRLGEPEREDQRHAERVRGRVDVDLGIAGLHAVGRERRQRVVRVGDERGVGRGDVPALRERAIWRAEASDDRACLPAAARDVV